MLDLAAELRRLAGQHGEAKRLIRRDGLAERFGLDHDEAGLIEHPGTHQVRLPIENGGGQQEITGPHEFDQRFVGAADCRAIPRCR